MAKTDYKSAGVDIDAGNEAVRRIGTLVKKTFNPSVLTGIGSFGSMVELTDIVKKYREPVLIQSIDGVGTKVTVAKMAGRYRGLGYDVVSATFNDILVHGARPLSFLDYIANERLDPAVVEEIVAGMSDNCAAHGIPLVGGETAEMPSTYLPGEHDVVGCVAGIVEKSKIINGSSVQAGDAVLGVASNGLHTNGYSLARKLFFELGGYSVDSHLDALGETVGEALLRTHLNYAPVVYGMTDAGMDVRALAHITGGGFLENIPRVLPQGCGVEVARGSWEIQPVFRVMADIGELSESECLRTFNMGVGLVVILPQEQAGDALAKIQASGFTGFQLGSVVAGESKVCIV